MSELTDKILKKQGIRTGDGQAPKPANPPVPAEPKPAPAPSTAAPTPPKVPKKRKPKKPRTPDQYDANQETKGRLPDGAAFTVVYHADRQCWTGILTVPNVGVFTGEASGVFRLLAALDGQYRAKVAGEKVGETSGADDGKAGAAPSPSLASVDGTPTEEQPG